MSLVNFGRFSERSRRDDLVPDFAPTEHEPLGIVRRIDSLGRIVVPAELRKLAGISPGDSIEFSYFRGTIGLTRVGPACVLCASSDELVERHGKCICRDCLRTGTSDA
jgi:transcriptional pleiotropic regulator of transition state genes